jgi:hypothetical protein
VVQVPYVRLRAEDVPEEEGIWGWAAAAPELLEALGLNSHRALEMPLAGPRGEGGGSDRRRMREGLATLFATEPSHPHRTLYLEALQLCDPGFERWLSRRIARAFACRRPELALRHAVAAVNVRPGRAESRFNLGLMLTRIASREPGSPYSRRWAALARGEFAWAAELSPDLFWGYYHRGVLAYETSLPEAARADWLQFLDRYVADKPAPRDVDLRLLPLAACPESAEIPGLAYAVLLDLLGLSAPKQTREPAPN